jgi:F-type H+-transporting ATPase subunit b
MKRLTAISLLLASPAFASVPGTPFLSLYNTNFVVAIAFVIFIGVLIYFKLPGILIGLLDKRADSIRGDLDEARNLREEAQELRASFERQQFEVHEQADRIVAKAKADAQESAIVAKADLAASIVRRLKAAEDQIASAEAGAVRDVRNKAVTISVAAARTLIAKSVGAAENDALVESAIANVQAKLH